MSERAALTKTSEKKAKDSTASKPKENFYESLDSPVEQILHLQRTMGNQAVQRLIKSGAIQAKLTIGKPNDKYEQEVDRVADKVMSMPELKGSVAQRKSECLECQEKEGIQTKPLADQITPLVQRHPDEEEVPVQGKLLQRQEAEEEEPTQTKLLQRQEKEEEEKSVQAKPVHNQTPAVTSNFEANVNSLKGGGKFLPESTRSYFEPRFGTDFSQVRVHTDSKAGDAAKSINAKAFTTGKDVVFGSGQYSPETTTGKNLLAHELTHVVQQSSLVSPQLQRFNGNQDKEGQSTHKSPSADFIKEGWDEVNELGIVYQETGANLRDKPLPEKDGSTVITKLPQNTKVFILKHDKKNRWIAVSVVASKGAGKFGYIADWLVWRKLPEPDVNVYKIKSGDYPLLIAAQKRNYFSVFKKWGEDLRFVVNALVYVNTNAKHNGTGEPGLRKKDNDVTKNWILSKATKNVYIWLPSSTFLKSIYTVVVEKGGGTGSITADIWESVKKFAKKLAYGAAFIGGLIHGFVKSIVDAIVGIVEMVIDLFVSIFTGNVLDDAEELWNAIKGLTWEDIKNEVGDWALKWGKKLASKNPFVAGHAYGYLVGYVMGEAFMLLAGGVAIAKGAAKFAKFAKAIKATKAFKNMAKGIEKVREAGGKAKELLKKATKKLRSKKKAPIVVILFKVSRKLRKKILWGERVPGSNRVIGGHFRGIVGHPKFSVEKIGTSSINPGCDIVKFVKELPGGAVSKIKKSTLFPRGWSKSDIIKAIENIANNPTTKIVSGDATHMTGKVKGVTIEVIIRGGKIVSGYPL